MATDNEETCEIVTPQQTILLTGAAGVVGAALIPRLARHRVIALVHKQSPATATECVTGDLTAPGMGLTATTARRLADVVDVVVHCAAVTDFGAGPATTERLNVTGTANVIEFAGQAGATLHHLSTAFVTCGALARTNAGEGGADPSDYLASKLAAEQLVRDSGIPATIVRPSVVIGDSATGAIAKFQGLHSLALATIKGSLPLVPLDRGSQVDFVPQDHLATAIARLVDARVSAGEYWVTAGERALSAEAMIDILVAEAARLGIHTTPPRLVPPDIVDRLVRPVFIQQLPKGMRRRFDDMLAMTALFTGADTFPDTVTDIPGCRALTATELASSFRNFVCHLAAAKGMVAAGTAAA